MDNASGARVGAFALAHFLCRVMMDLHLRYDSGHTGDETDQPKASDAATVMACMAPAVTNTFLMRCRWCSRCG